MNKTYIFNWAYKVYNCKMSLKIFPVEGRPGISVNPSNYSWPSFRFRPKSSLSWFSMSFNPTCIPVARNLGQFYRSDSRNQPWHKALLDRSLTMFSCLFIVLYYVAPKTAWKYIRLNENIHFLTVHLIGIFKTRNYFLWINLKFSYLCISYYFFLYPV